jgi:YfiH family protein
MALTFLTTGLDDIKWVSHGFFTRRGGASGGIYDSLNCAYGSQDAPDAVAANREKVAESLDLKPENIVSVYQIHSNKVVTVNEPWPREKAPQADALITDKRGIGLGILTADCAPILFASKKKKVVAAAHAGWKGALTGIVEETVRNFSHFGVAPGDIAAAIGPCIGPESYEVKDDFKKPFMEQDAANEKFFRAGARAGHLIFDLPGYIADRLRKIGVGQVIDTRQDTLPNEAAFFSYRRTTLRGEKDYGRQMSVIAIR